MFKIRTFLLNMCFAFTVVGLLAGQASAGLYRLDVDTASRLRDLSYSDTGGTLEYIGINDGTQVGTKVYGTRNQYGEYFQNAVGFMGQLEEDLAVADSDMLASVRIGAAGTSALAIIQGAGLYDGFLLPIANDNDDLWEFQAYVVYDTLTEDPVTYTSGDFVKLFADTKTSLIVNFGTDIDFQYVTDLGFVVQGDWDWDVPPSNPDFYHVSIIPTPAAILLGILGLGVAGWKLRKFA